MWARLVTPRLLFLGQDRQDVGVDIAEPMLRQTSSAGLERGKVAVRAAGSYDSLMDTDPPPWWYIVGRAWSPQLTC